MSITSKARIGRRRWSEVVAYLTNAMKNSTSEKMRMQAALRLADILTLREEREQLELRRELRLQSKADAAQGDTPAPEPESVDEFLARVSGGNRGATEVSA